MADINSMNIRCCSFNCNSIRKKVDIIRKIMNSYDVIFLQEIILLHEDIDFVMHISSEFDAHILPSRDPSDLCGGRPSGNGYIMEKVIGGF